MHKLNDKSYVMRQLRRATDLGKLDEALSLIAGTQHGDNDAAADWPSIRKEMDKLLAVVKQNEVCEAYQVSFEETADVEFGGWSLRLVNAQY